MPRPNLVLSLLSLATAGCLSYPERTHDAYSAFRSGRLRAAVESYRDSRITGSDFLSGAEAGAVALTAGDWSGAIRDLSRAAAVVEALERRALVEVDASEESVAAWVLEDTLDEYRGEGFERVLLHAGLALAHLAAGHLDDVWVEARLANRLLEREEELYGRQYAAGGLGRFLAALAHEIWGEPEAAYLEYRRMEERGVGLELAGRSLVRLATESGRDDELPRLVEDHGPDYDRPDGAATIVVLAGVGLGPVKVEVRRRFPTPDGVATFAVPEFVDLPQPVPALELSIGSSRVRTAVIEDVSEVLQVNLADRLSWTAARIGAEPAGPAGAVGAVGAVVGSMSALTGGRADLRAWQSLPDTWQAVRVFVPPGVHSLELAAIGGRRLELGTYRLVPGETMLVFARTVERALYAYPVGGVEVDEAAPGWELPGPAPEPPPDDGRP